MRILEVKTEARRLGDFGERAAVRMLRRSGYKILERAYAPDGAEIDIIAESKDAVAFIEVKTRSIAAKSAIEPRPASAVTPEKQRGIIKTAQIYLAYHPPKKHVRFDIIEVYASGEVDKWKVENITHIKAAFDRDSARPKRFGK